MSEYKIIPCRYGKKCRSRDCRYDHSAAVMALGRQDSDDELERVFSSTKRARLDDEDKRQITHQQSLSEDDLKVYEVRDLFPDIDITKIHEGLALFNYDTQKCIDYLFKSSDNNDNNKNNNNNDNGNNNDKKELSEDDTNNKTPIQNNTNNNNSDDSVQMNDSDNNNIANNNYNSSLSTSPDSSVIVNSSSSSPSHSSSSSLSNSTSTYTTTTTTTSENIPMEDELDPKESLQCEICLERKKIDFMFVMQQCEHGFCRDCINGYFTVKINDKAFPIKCPNYGCTKEATLDDMEMILDKSMIDKYSENSFRNAIRKNPVFSCCPTPDCSYIFFYTTSDSPDFGCPTCKKRYCLDCRVDYHTGSTCKEYQKWSLENGQADDLFGEFVRGHKFKQCPGCRHWVEKSEGCDHMTCTCGNEFCYRCGGEYQDGCVNNCGEDGDDEDEDEEEEDDY